MKLDDLSRLRESWVIFFFLGVIMLNFPFLEIFNKDVHLFGIPLLVLYFLIGWPLSIVVIYFFSRSLDPAGSITPDDDEDGSDSHPQNRP